MLVSIERMFGHLWVIITPDKPMFYVSHMYTQKHWQFETLGM